MRAKRQACQRRTRRQRSVRLGAPRVTSRPDSCGPAMQAPSRHAWSARGRTQSLTRPGQHPIQLTSSVSGEKKCKNIIKLCTAVAALGAPAFIPAPAPAWVPGCRATGPVAAIRELLELCSTSPQPLLLGGFVLVTNALMAAGLVRVFGLIWGGRAVRTSAPARSSSRRAFWPLTALGP